MDKQIQEYAIREKDGMKYYYNTSRNNLVTNIKNAKKFTKSKAEAMLKKLGEDYIMELIPEVTI